MELIYEVAIRVSDLAVPAAGEVVEEASERGQLVLDAVTADECVWQLNVARYFVTT